MPPNNKETKMQLWPPLASQELKKENQDLITIFETNNPPQPDTESQMPQGKPAEISHNQTTKNEQS